MQQNHLARFSNTESSEFLVQWSWGKAQRVVFLTSFLGDSVVLGSTFENHWSRIGSV